MHSRKQVEPITVMRHRDAVKESYAFHRLGNVGHFVVVSGTETSGDLDAIQGDLNDCSRSLRGGNHNGSAGSSQVIVSLEVEVQLLHFYSERVFSQEIKSTKERIMKNMLK